MANRKLNIVTQLAQFKKEHGLDKNESLYSIVTRLSPSNSLVDETAMMRLQQDITEVESFNPQFIMKLMQTAHKVMR